MELKSTLKALAFATALAAPVMTPANAQDAVNVSYQPALYWALPYYVADQKGWWDEVGLAPSYSTFPSGAPQVAAAAAGSWDVGGTGSAPAVLGAARFDIITIGITNNESAGNAMMARGDEIDAIRADPSSLKGAQLLVTTNSTGEYAAAACIESFGLNYPEDVEVVNLNQQEIISAFATGTGKLAGLWAPNIYTLESRAGAALLCSGQDAGAIVPGALIARRDYAEANPEMVAKYLAVYLRGVNWIRNNKEEAVSMMADFYARTGVELPDEFLIREIDTRPMFTLDEQLELMAKNGGQSTAEEWFGGLGGYMTSTGTLESELDPSSFIDPTYMQLVKDTPELASFAAMTE
ncbi:ABC transporter substrate-binding protein [Parasulfitobacter algicola]|uniref:ABC transporter substrate-binding protein n=1 Tax=Parasulfitobacter algicola TaxID=2614809 RepID=A0ABX2IUC7_9RHOB|nr:ABC transporter substrate-binding protein [Sulfitobacter algicola]NSX56160.1 ABC transporter substrate-binding protein [Sulfitobacter algicola]